MTYRITLKSIEYKVVFVKAETPEQAAANWTLKDGCSTSYRDVLVYGLTEDRGEYLVTNVEEVEA